MTPGAGVLEVRRGDINHIVKILYFLQKSSTLLRGIDQTNYIYSNDDQGRVYQNYKFHDPWDRGSFARAWPYKVSDTQVTFKACGPLVRKSLTNTIGYYMFVIIFFIQRIGG